MRRRGYVVVQIGVKERWSSSLLFHAFLRYPPPEIRIKTTSGWEALLKPGWSNTQQTCRIGMTSTLEIICQICSWATLPPTNFSSSRCCCSSDMLPMWWKGGLFWSHVLGEGGRCVSLNMISLYRYIPTISICEGRCNFQRIMCGIYNYFGDVIIIL